MEHGITPHDQLALIRAPVFRFRVHDGLIPERSRRVDRVRSGQIVIGRGIGRTFSGRDTGGHGGYLLVVGVTGRGGGKKAKPRGRVAWTTHTTESVSEERKEKVLSYISGQSC